MAKINKGFSVNRFATLWQCECDYEETGRFSILLIEPLETSAPKNARASWSFGNIEFINPHSKGREDWYYDKNVRHHDMCEVAPALVLMRNGYWYEVGMPKIVWRNDYECWVLERTARRNTRHANMMNGGMEFYKTVRDMNEIENQISITKEALK